MIHRGVLNKTQLTVLKKMGNIIPEGYLAGGTALALQLGHRTSLDLDFYIKKHFVPEILINDFKRRFSAVETGRTAKDTLILKIDSVNFSLFHYPYKQINPLVSFGSIKLASIPDIAAMKMVAISTRGKRRDFIDTFYILRKYSLDKIIRFTLKKYPTYQPIVILKGLIYFEDAREEDLGRGIKMFDKNFSWEEAKKKIIEEVRKYQLKMLKK